MTCWNILEINGQNLVRNGDFEEFSSFDNFDFGYKTLENNITTWRTPTQGTSRIYSDPKTAKSGKVFAGVHVFGIENYREYISTPLNCRLIAGETYRFKMYIKLSSNSEFAISTFGVSFTQGRPDIKTTNRLQDSAQILVKNTGFYMDKKAWVLIEDTFKAQGNESFMTIGNFLDDETSVTKKAVLMAREGRSYYYIDDVSLVSTNGHDPCKAVIDSFDCTKVTLSRHNICPDPSFECYTSCPSNVNTTKLHQLEHWDQTSGTPDYYNSCSIIMSVPNNIMGKEAARTGHGYVGMYLFDKENYREFLSARLRQPLQKERWYVIKLYAALSENSGLATDAFEFLLSEKKPVDGDTINRFPDLATQLNARMPDDTTEINNIKAKIEELEQEEAERLIEIKPQVINQPGNFGDSYTWKKICGMYLAEGGEQFITLGNFNDNANTPLKVMNDKAGEFAYYFIDDFTVEPLNDSNLSDCGAGIPMEPEEENFTTPRFFQDLDLPELLNSEPFTFQGFYFEFDKFDILDTNYFFLDSLIELLGENEDLTIEVHGHTDDVGSKKYNEKIQTEETNTKSDQGRTPA